MREGPSRFEAFSPTPERTPIDRSRSGRGCAWNEFGLTPPTPSSPILASQEVSLVKPIDNVALRCRLGALALIVWAGGCQMRGSRESRGNG